MGILAHRAVQKLDDATGLRKFVQQQDLMGVIAGEAIGGGEQQAVEDPGGDLLAESFQAGAVQGRTAEAVVAEDEIVSENPALSLGMDAQAIQLLVNGLGLGLVLRRNAHIQSNTHQIPPVRESLRGSPPEGAARGAGGCPAGSGRPDPSAARHSPAPAIGAALSTAVSWAPPQEPGRRLLSCKVHGSAVSWAGRRARGKCQWLNCK